MKLPPLNELLASGGDSRIVPAPETGLNKYGCAVMPQPGDISFGSCTASTISPEGFAAARQLYDRLPSSSYAQEMGGIREELEKLLGHARTDIVFAASGTDLHLLVSQLAAGAGPLLAILPEAMETGSGVHDAIGGRHFSECAAFSPSVTKGSAIEGAKHAEIKIAACRNADGTPRDIPAIDGQVSALTEAAVTGGKQVLLTLIDASKTGMIAPSPAQAIALKKCFPGKVEVLVDACQLRLAPSTVRAYLDQDFIVAITGSKFAEGPAFCGALLVPQAASARLAARALSAAFSAYSVQGDWPEGWAARRSLGDTPNYGLLLRWQAALTSLRAFYALPEKAVADFLTGFAAVIGKRLLHDPAFEPLPVSTLARSPLSSGNWDAIPTIFPFLLRRGSGVASREETQRIYERLRTNHLYLGQPVACGARGAPISALRLCLGMRTITDGLTGRGKETVIAEALSLLDKTAKE